MVDKYIGFYWTLPVMIARPQRGPAKLGRKPPSGFRELPSNVEEAAACSKTISYQMHMIRHWIQNNRDTRLIDESVFIDVRPDRGTNAVIGALQMLRQKHPDPSIGIIRVRFSETLYWRHHRFLEDYIEHSFPRSRFLPPVAHPVEGVLFDPIVHFEKSRERFNQESARLEGSWLGELELSWSKFHALWGWPKHVAADLNEKGVRTKSLTEKEVE